MRRLIAPLTLACALLFLSPWPALAAIAISEIVLYDGSATLSKTDLDLEYFNAARCQCGKPLRLQVRLTPDRSQTDSLFVVAGSGTCINTTNNSIDTTNCNTVFSAKISEIDTNIDQDVTVSQLMNNDCTADKTFTIYVFTGSESSVTQAYALTFTADGVAPTAPVKGDDPKAGEGLVEVHFSAGSSSQQNVRYQILCENADTGAPAFPAGRFTAEYLRKEDACPNGTIVSDGGSDDGVETIDASAGLDASTSLDADAASMDGPRADLAIDSGGTATVDGSQDDGSTSAALLELDPDYLCSGAQTSDGTVQVKGLTNGTRYHFYVVAFDRHDNPSAPVDLGIATPVQAEDLWERYKRSGGSAEGGLCQVDGSQRASLFLGLALLALVVGWARRKRR